MPAFEVSNMVGLAVGLAPLVLPLYQFMHKNGLTTFVSIFNHFTANNEYEDVRRSLQALTISEDSEES
jgi:hypothetical protein